MVAGRVTCRTLRANRTKTSPYFTVIGRIRAFETETLISKDSYDAII
jgi:hypothetical protein